MIIDFKDIEQSHLEHFKGGEGALDARMFTNELGKIMLASLEPGSTIGLHTHEGNSEIIYMLEGEGVVYYDDGKEIVRAGQVHYCPMNHSHSLRNESECSLRFFAVVPEHNVDK